MRKVFVKSNQSEGVYTHETEATTFGDLKKELSSTDVKFNFSGQRAVVKPGMVDLKEDAATLPTDDFYLFLIPEKQKAGMSVESMGYQELKTAIKEAIENDGQVAKEHFGNYTILSTESLRALLNSYKQDGQVDAGVQSAVDSLTEGVKLINDAIPVIAGAIRNLQTLAKQGVESVPEKIGGLTLEELNAVYSELEKTTKR